MNGWLLVGGLFDEALNTLLGKLNIPGGQLIPVNYDEITYLVEDGLPARLWLQGAPVDPPDFFMIVDGGGEQLRGVANQLEKLGAVCINRFEAKQIARSKLATYQVLAAAGVPIVRTLVCDEYTTPEQVVAQLGLPCVVKPDDGFGGEGVILISSKEELDTQLEKIKKSPERMLIQQYISTSKGRDVRVITIGGEAVFAACRQATDPAEFRSNLKVGGQALDYSLTDEIRTLCAKVSRAIGLDFSGIDLLFGPEGFVVGEVNSVPGYGSWVGKADLAAVFMKMIASKLRQSPYPRWRADALLENSRRKPLAELLCGMENPEFVKATEAVFGRCEQVQRTVLMEIVERCADTEWGREHGFLNIHTLEEFRATQPLTSWEDYRAYSERIREGEENLLFPGRADFICITSGTTGQFKYIPESKLYGFARKALGRARMIPRVKALGGKPISAILAFSNASRMEELPSGIPCGTASGRSGEMIDQESRDRVAYPLELANHFAGDDLNYIMLRCALTHRDMTGISGNNALRFTRFVEYGIEHAQELIGEIRRGSCRYAFPPELEADMARYLTPDPGRADELQALLEAGKFIPKYYWPGLSLAGFWLGGSLGAYVAGARALLPEITRFTDIGYGASEVKINIPMRPETPAGALASFCGFFEFIPEAGGSPLLAHELTDGERYELVVTTYNGLYRYQMHDLVQVEGFTGTTPNIYFVSKTGDMANMAQEKIPGAILAEQVRRAASELGLTVDFLQIHTDSEAIRYRICAEASGDISETLRERFEEKIEETLRRENAAYDYVRSIGQLGAPAVQWMKRGWQDHLLALGARKTGSISQVKLPVVVAVAPEKEWVL